MSLPIKTIGPKRNWNQTSCFWSPSSTLSSRPTGWPSQLTGPFQVRLDQIRLGQVRSGQVRLGYVTLGQVRSGQVQSGQVRSGQVRLGQVSFQLCFMLNYAFRQMQVLTRIGKIRRVLAFPKFACEWPLLSLDCIFRFIFRLYIQ